MDTKDMEFLGEFLKRYKDGQVKPPIVGNLPGEGDIADRLDVQLNICHSLLMLHAQSGGRHHTMQFVGHLIGVHGALGFALAFAEELTRAALGMSKIQNEIDQNKADLDIRPRDMYLVGSNLKAFKEALVEQLEAHGGLTKVAKLAGMSQPSLSRMLNSDAVPRESTIRRLFEVMAIDSIKIKKG